MRPKFTIVTLGCRVNQCESEALAKELTSLGWDRAGRGDRADAAIVNTCCVTQKAAMQSRQAIRRAIRGHVGAQIIATGCYAQTEPEAIGRIAGVCAIIGQSDKHRLARLLAHGRPLPEALSPIARQTVFSPFAEPALGNRARPLVKIQDGCNSFCTYCIVPYARGRSRSLAPEAVVAAIDRIRAAGYHEAVLTGIHMGAYGLDLQPPTRLYDLLARLAAENPIGRIRLSSIEPQELGTDIIELVARHPLFCRHFHIPLQSADDGILRAMARPYTAAEAIATVTRIAELIPDAAIGADIIVGFPGESAEAFQRTLDCVARLPLTYLHVFPFSPRQGTVASHLKGRLAPAQMEARCRRLRQVGQAKKMAFWRCQVDKTVDVIAEMKIAEGGFRAMSDNYIPVVVKHAVAPNTVVRVRLASAGADTHLYGLPC